MELKRLTFGEQEFIGDKIVKDDNSVTLYNEEVVVVSLQGVKENEYTIEGAIEKTEYEVILEQLQMLGQQITNIMLGGV